MLHVFSGNDAVSVRTAAHEYIDTLTGEDVELIRIDTDNYAPGVCADLANSDSLFGSVYVYVLDNPSASAVFAEEVVDSLEILAATPSVVVLIEQKLTAAKKKRIQPHAVEFKEITAPVASRFNTFALAEALARKDKKSGWLLLQQARQASQSDEEIIGVLWWQLKMLRLAARTGTPEEAGVKPYPYQKAKQALKTFQVGELETLSRTLLAVYHDGHAGEVSLSEALETWVLKM